MATAVGSFNEGMTRIPENLRTARILSRVSIMDRAIAKAGIGNLKLSLGQKARLTEGDIEMLNRPEYFPQLSAINYEGPESINPLSYHYFNPEIVIPSLGMKMGELLNFAMPAWHFNTAGTDMFSGVPSITHPWDSMRDPFAQAVVRTRALFEFSMKMGIPNHCWHDGDYVDLTLPIRTAEEQFTYITDVMFALQNQTGMKTGWGTNQLFAIPLYRMGAGTSPYLPAFVRAARQASLSIDKAISLGANNFVFWGGREGVYQLLSTMTSMEKAHMAKFLWMCVEHAEGQGFFEQGGTFLIEPKGKEPTLHQYDRDVETCIAFLKENGLDKYFKFNVEVNHAYLAGSSAEHEFQMAIDRQMLGGIDANEGSTQVGWDLDQYATLSAGLAIGSAIYQNRGLQGGVINHDAKLQGYNSSAYPMTMAEAVIGSQDACAIGLWRAHFLAVDGRLGAMIADRYSTWATPDGEFAYGPEASLKSLSPMAIAFESQGLLASLPETRAEAMQRVVDESTLNLRALIAAEAKKQGF